jgi:hypothetical protein
MIQQLDSVRESTRVSTTKEGEWEPRKKASKYPRLSLRTKRNEHDFN